MLCLSRKPNEEVIVAGEIIVTVISIHGNVVRLGFSAPADIPIARREVYVRDQGHIEKAVKSC